MHALRAPGRMGKFSLRALPRVLPWALPSAGGLPPASMPHGTAIVTECPSMPAQQQGNDALKQGLAVRKKFYLRKAVDHYGEGLAAEAGDDALSSVLYANRAQASFHHARSASIAPLASPSCFPAKFVHAFDPETGGGGSACTPLL